MLFSLISLFVLSACDESDDELIFLLNEMSNSENVQFDYYFTDASEKSKVYWIGANSKESSLVISCADAESVMFEDFEGETFTEYVSAKGHWSAKIINSNTVVFTFEKIAPGSESSAVTIVDIFDFVVKSKKHTEKAKVQVTRLINSSAPLS